MPARIVVVYDEPACLDEAVSALSLAGHDPVGFTDTMAALRALDAPQQVSLLITRMRFPPGRPQGISLARVLKTKRPELKILFTAQPELAEHAEGIGEFLALPVSMTALVATVDRILRSCAGAPSRRLG
jgi:DNA-binding NtrC family response regulator